MNSTGSKELQVGEFQHRLSGRLYDATDFNHLFHGHDYPGFVERPGSYGSYWWDDFADTEVPHFSREHRERIWGQEFVLAQDIVLAVLSNRWPSRGAPNRRRIGSGLVIPYLWPNMALQLTAYSVRSSVALLPATAHARRSASRQISEVPLF